MWPYFDSGPAFSFVLRYNVRETHSSKKVINYRRKRLFLASPEVKLERSCAILCALLHVGVSEWVCEKSTCVRESKCKWVCGDDRGCGCL